MEEAVLRKLDEMFRDVREEIKLKHMDEVHSPKEHHQAQCFASRSYSNVNANRRQSLPSHVTTHRRVSMPAKLGTASRRDSDVPSISGAGDGRRSSLPVIPNRRNSSAEAHQLHQRRTSTHSTGSSSRKFSRDSIDLDLVIEDAAEADVDSDYSNSIIVEEDEESSVSNEVGK